MIKPEKALKIILERARPLGIEEINLVDSLGRVLAEKVYSDIDIPAFNRSAMDGFAVNSKDLSKVFEIIEDIPAGYVPKKKIKFGQCARIMTGAMLPIGTDKVVKVENTKLTADGLKITALEKKLNVSLRGEDVKKGELVLDKGTKIRPQEGAMLATVGKTSVKVYRRPKVAVISTGSELVEPSQKPAAGQIRNSNGTMLLFLLKRFGTEINYFGIAPDDFLTTKEMIEKALKTADIVILSGGVSVGDYDFVSKALNECGVDILFDRVAIQPGKPTTFGVKGDKYVFGLPGNPVSVFVSFELFVTSLINGLTNRKEGNKYIDAVLTGDFERKNAERELYYPVGLLAGYAVPLKFHGSGHLFSLASCNALMRVKKGIKFLKNGETVNVRPI
ncbi:hypothetical protein A2276_06775 [candidate division WOR-1 bacterium RIFOXYA12_FULL_43_27]|uniref:Molybdopterin molybdenumtransferase n=1 Tax=candidate division WOR-1 bacterium RIFOXYC2_FULL_46_14 TaxID=1802587 RepID=A0A1F4U5I3_UNCSA|nr:MAG: hypothetical protein A2276_06775 [candidate division WOR-1 bacterium RIFOXYA12_FULL_43_27]OGC20350.1 MAG: hypothetical protein A2292_04775 [candidate division WOR-1 bacterium RIFOXYB2_FULL_46_45]OGC31913.1 MAG: hypothetical protein A2232_06675 [candidate division WOR-1 bacterium RIFOXYA2_FULL_46_56]OGC40196.1 MAG: hypothetical protein A2438_02795 [candidate division WOR-1 bacterium RIFOXYC2_FULL_46_14]